MLQCNYITEPIARKINILLLGSCEQGKSTLLNRIEQEQKQNQKDLQLIEQDSDNDYEEEEEIYDNFQDKINPAIDKLYSQLKINHTICLFKNSFQENSEYANVFDIFLQSSYFEVLALLINAKVGLFESAKDQNFDYLKVSKLSSRIRVVFLITNMGSTNWDNQRFNQIVQFIQKSITEPFKLNNFTIIPIDSIQGFNISKQIPDTICSWYQGQTLVQDLEDQKFEDKGLFSLKLIRNENIYPNSNSSLMKYYLCKVLSGSINDISYPINFNINQGKSVVIINQIYDLTQKPIKSILINDLIYIELQNDYQICIGDIFTVNEKCQFVKTQEILAEVQLFQLQTSILTLGYYGKLQLIGQIIEFEIINVEYVLDEKQKKTKRTFLKSNEHGGVKIKINNPICVDKYENNERLGSFLIFSDDTTLIGQGKIQKIKPL